MKLNIKKFISFSLIPLLILSFVLGLKCKFYNSPLDISLNIILWLFILAEAIFYFRDKKLAN